MSPPLPPTSPYIADPATGGASPVPRVAAAAGRDAGPLAGPVPVTGIAATVDRDTDLAVHPSVLIYDDLISKDYIKTAFRAEGNPPVPPTIDANVEIISWPQFGLSAARCWAITTNQRLIAWHHWAEPLVAGKAWTRPYGDGHTHLFFRYLMVVGTDLEAAYNEQGMKLPGMAGTYDWSTSGAVTLPAPSAFAIWEGRLWHGRPLTAEGYQLACYFYGVRDPRGHRASYGRYAGSGNPHGPLFTSGYLKPGVLHCIEQEVKLNTVKNPALQPTTEDDCDNNANADGEMRIWLDGVKVYEATTVGYRGDDRCRIQGVPFCNIYHGGLGLPKAPFHYDIGGLCIASEYIGPPKRTVEPETSMPVGKSSLSSLAASMGPGTWAELIAEDIDAVIGVGLAGSGIAIPYTNSVPWCPIRKRIVVVSTDHGDTPSRHIEYDDATNRYLLIDRGLGSHGYQHLAVDPYSSDIYQRWSADLYRYTGTTWVRVTAIPFNISQIASVALAWWSGPYPGAGGHGVLTVYNGNYGGTISAFDPTVGNWLPDLTGMFPGQLGQYHVVSAYSAKHNCLVYGGGNTSQGVNPVDRQLWRLNADLSKTRMPDAPHSIGIYHGMNLVSDSSSGNIIAFGFGEGWELNPSGAGTWTQMTGARAPPQGLLSPNVPPNGVISCDVSSYGVVVYVDALRTRTPKCRMWVYKSGGAGVNAAAANYEGQWWNTPGGSEAGWGINFAHQGDVIFATWFTYDASGNAWYMSMTGLQGGPGTFAGTLYQTTGPPLDADPFDPNRVQRVEVGNGTLTFLDGNHATFAYTVNGISQTKSITRQEFGPLPTCTWGGLANLALATNYQDLWWAVGGAESGWGINLAHQGDVIFATWFTYDFSGAALPLSATLTKVGSGVYSGTLIKAAGPPFSAVPFNSGAVTRTEVGTATVTFSAGDAGTFSYQVSLGGQSVSGTKAIERQVFRAPGTVCQ